jgi:AcrR family transcriptional regulator
VNQYKTKGGKKMLDSSTHTKDQIFRKALRLFAINGYENVSVRTIADEVGIKAASIYNHYKSKEDILYACYDYYTERMYMSRLPKERYEHILREGSKSAVFNVINYKYPEDVAEDMVLGLLVIYSRIYTDPYARKIHVDEINASMEYLRQFFKTGVEIGRFDSFDYTSVSLIIFGSRMLSAQTLAILKDELREWRAYEPEIIQELMRLIPFRY